MFSSYRPMPDASGKGDTSDFHNWDAERLAFYFRQKGLGDYEETLKKHKITGQLAPLLSDSDLKDMGVTIVGDRLLFQRCIKDLSRRERHQARIQVLWEGVERVFFSSYDRACFTCCGLCPVDPSTYRLTNNHLKVKKVRPVRCGPIPLFCFGASYVSNNIDLSKVDDVDVFGIPAPCPQRICCCANGKDKVEVESRFEKGGKVFLVLPEGQGETVSNLILNQVEESQKMERAY